MSPVIMVSVPKNAALAALLKGSGAHTGVWEGAVNEMSAAADASSGAPSAVDVGGDHAGLADALAALLAANEGNAAAPQLAALVAALQKT